MHDNSARQSWTLDPGATSALGSPPSATQFQPSGQAWASEVSKRTQHGARSSLQAHPQVFLCSKARDVPQEGFTSPRQQSQHWRTKSPTIKGTPSMKYLVSLKNTQQKDLPLTNRKEVWSYWVRTCELQGNQWKALEGLDSHPHNRPHHHGYQCHYELPVWKLTNGTILGFFKSTKSGYTANRPPIQFTLTCLSRKRGPQDSPDDQIWV